VGWCRVLPPKKQTNNEDTFLAAALFPELCQRFPFTSTIPGQFCISLSKILSI